MNGSDVGAVVLVDAVETSIGVEWRLYPLLCRWGGRLPLLLIFFGAYLCPAILSLAISLTGLTRRDRPKSENNFDGERPLRFAVRVSDQLSDQDISSIPWAGRQFAV